MCMEYFKKLQCYKPKKAIIDSPISIEEVALLQNSVDKDILGRIKFINRSQQSIIAIFVHLSASNIAGEPVTIERERYIYQDMKIEPGELYGNKIPLHLPDDTRLLSVKLDKVVFENGTIWDASTGTECEYITQEEISIPDIIVDEMRKELSTHFPHIEYIHYYYEEGENFWECTCGKVNHISNKTCSFCENGRDAQKKYLVQDKLIPLMAQNAHDKQEKEEEETRKILEEARIEKEKRFAEREKEKQQFKEVESKDKKIKLCILIVSLICISLAIIVLFYQKKKSEKNTYNNEQEILDSENSREEQETFDINSKEKYSKEIDETDQSEYENNRKNIAQYFIDPDSKDTIMISNLLACKNKDREYFEKYTGVNLANLETYEPDSPNFNGEYSIKYTLNDITLFDQRGFLNIYFKKENTEADYLLDEIFFSFDKQPDDRQEFCISNVKKMLGKDYDSYQDDPNYGIYCSWEYEFLKVTILDVGFNTDVATTDICFS